MNLLYIADNGFSYHKGKFYCTLPNRTNIDQYQKYFDEIHIIARKTEYTNKSFEVDVKSKVFLIPKLGFIDLYKAMKNNVDLYDVVLVRNGINGCFAVIFAKCLKKITIAYCGSDPYEFQITKGSFWGNIIAPVWGYLEKLKMGQADYSQYCTQYLYKKYPTNKPYLICSNVDIQLNYKDLEERIFKIENKEDNTVIGMIGKINVRKGVRTIIQALSILGKNYSFELIGDGSPDLFENEIQSLGLEENIHFLGYQSDKHKIKEWLKNIDVYIQPSFSEGLPRATIEAMAVGCPCVTTDVAGLPDLLKKEYLIKPKDYVALADKVKWLACNKLDAISAAKQNFNKAKEFNRNIRDKRLDDFYNKIAKK